MELKIDPILSRPFLFRLLFRAICFISTILLPGAMSAHEFWIDATPYQFAPGAAVTADLRNGQEFSGISLPYLTNSFDRFASFHNDNLNTYLGRNGDFPAFRRDDLSATGLLIIAHETSPSEITYDSWQKFETFAAEKGLLEDVSQSRSDIIESGFRETYSRHAKSLIAIGAGDGADRNLNLEIELIALNNPYAHPSGLPFRIELRFRDRPLQHHHITVFSKPIGTTQKTQHIATYQTDLDGRISLDLSPGLEYLIDAVVLLPLPQEETHKPAKNIPLLWHSYWASLTFAAPK